MARAAYADRFTSLLDKIFILFSKIIVFRYIYLMDDPSSAVDIHVGNDMFNHQICGALKDNTVVSSPIDFRLFQ